AFGTTQLAAHGVPLLVAVALAVAGAGGAGYLVGFAAARLAGSSLALATWGLAWLVYTALVLFPRLSGGSQGLTRPTPAALTSPSLGIEIVLQPWVHAVVGGLLVVVLALILIRAEAGPWGLDWAALRTGPALADSLGVPVQRRRRAVLAAAAALGALGGAGTAVLQGVVAPADYSPLLSLQLFVAVLVGGTATWWGPALGVALIAVLPTAADSIATAAGIDPLRARAVLTAVLLVGVLALRGPAARLLKPYVRLGRRPYRLGPAAESVDAAPLQDERTVGDPAPVLTLRSVVVDYGAVRALDGIDLDLRPGEVHALVGPNGSGKSTALRVAAGVVVPAGGIVEVRGEPVPATSAAPRVEAGVARTLQRTAMLGRLPVGRQVEVGTRVRDRKSFAGLRHLIAAPSATHERRTRAAATAAALDLTGLTDRAAADPDGLDTAEQRLLQVARAVATGASAVLVDEPAAGMSARQRDRLGGILRRLAGSGRGVLLVEHDMNLVGRVADRVTVLAEGRVLATGTPEAIRADPAVARAYLGVPPD
ncbi:MAG: branched-chain amino acid transport system ATP-binding protein livM, partial [Frankiaceae bacterium]|nr:branched-chain amino acid transport system ATP-binding protein livM [Frankiaceae bacterium]